MNICMITAHKQDGNYLEMNVGDDFWNMYRWCHILGAHHYCYDSITKENIKERLENYDVIILSGNPGYITKLVEIVNEIKLLNPKVVTIFYPEGDAGLYHEKGITPGIIEAWNACDILACLEEDKVSFYKELTTAYVDYVINPVPKFMVDGCYMRGLYTKTDLIIAYGDLNPTNYIVAIAIAKRLKKNLMLTAVSRDICEFIYKTYKIKTTGVYDEDNYTLAIPQHAYLRSFLGKAKYCIHMSKNIGTSRMAVSGACCGTPVIGWSESHTQKRLFPELCFNLYDIDSICDKIEKLDMDEEYYRKITDYAFEHVKFYDELNASRRLMKTIEKVK